MSPARAYFALQAVAFGAWWAVLVAFPGTRDAFCAPGAPFSTVAAFAAGDLAVIGLTVAMLVAASGDRAVRVGCGWAIAGAVGYAALYCATLFALTGGALLGAAAMAPAAAGPIWAARHLSRERVS